MSKKSNSFDIASKKMLKEKSLRAALVKYLIKGYQDKSFDQIKELLSDVTSSIDETVPHKRVGFDALFTVEDPVDKGKIGVFVNVETQGYKLKDEKLLNRALFYCSRMIIRQHVSKKFDFKKSNYEKIKKVYSIWIITSDNKRRNSIESICLHQKEDDKYQFKKYDYDKLEMIFIYTDSNYEEIKDDLIAITSMIFSVDESVKDRVDVLKCRYKLNLTDKEVDIMNGWVTKHDKEIKARIEKEGNEREAIGLEKGEAIGLEKGKAIGLEEGKAYAVNNLMSTLSIDFEKACTLLGINEDRDKILELVKSQVLSQPE